MRRLSFSLAAIALLAAPVFPAPVQACSPSDSTCVSSKNSFRNDVLARMIELVDRMSDPQEKAQALGAIARQHPDKASYLQKAIDTAQKISEPLERVHALSLLLEQSPASLQDRLLQMIASDIPKISTLRAKENSTLIAQTSYFLGHVGRFDLAERVINLDPSAEDRDLWLRWTFADSLAAQLKAGDSDGVFHALASQTSEQINPVELLPQLLPDLFIHSPEIEAAAKPAIQQIWQIRRLMALTNVSDLQPKVRDQLFAEAQRILQTISPGAGRLPAQLLIVQSLISHSQPEAAIAILKEITPQFIQANQGNSVSLILAWLDLKALDQANPLIQDMLKSSMPAPTKATAMIPVVNLLQAQDRMSEADAILSRLTQQLNVAPNSAQKTTALIAVAEGLHMSGKTESVRAIANQIYQSPSAHWEKFGYRLAILLDAAGERDKAIQAANTDPEKSFNMWDPLLSKDVEAAQFDRALALAQRVQNPGQKAFALIMIALELHKAEQVPQSEQTLAEALKIAQSLKSDDDTVINNVLYTYLRIGNYEQAFKVAKSVEDSGQQDRLVFNLLEYLNTARDFVSKPVPVSFQTSVAQAISDARIRDNAWREIAMQHFSKKAYSQALSTVRSIQNPVNQMTALINLLHSEESANESTQEETTSLQK